MAIAVVLGVLAGLMVGFLAGLFAFKVKQRWCPRCGEGLTCPSCVHAHSTRRV